MALASSGHRLMRSLYAPHPCTGRHEGAPELCDALAGPLLERAIGVIYRPQVLGGRQAF